MNPQPIPTLAYQTPKPHRRAERARLYFWLSLALSLSTCVIGFLPFPFMHNDRFLLVAAFYIPGLYCIGRYAALNRRCMSVFAWWFVFMALLHASLLYALRFIYF